MDMKPLKDKMRHAFGVLEHPTDPPLACEHVVAGERACACLEDPSSGFLCVDCMDDHFAVHHANNCHLCNSPLTDKDHLSSVVPAVPVKAGIVRHPGGEHFFAAREIALFFAACRTCADDYEREARGNPQGA